MIRKKIKNIALLLILCSLLSARLTAFNIIRICQVKNDVFITWTKLGDTCDNFISYKIYGRQKTGDTFTVIDEVFTYTTVDYLHINAGLKSDKWEYFLMADYICGNLRKIYTDTVFIDHNPPKVVDIDTVSINGKTVDIGWTKSSDPDVMGYIIYYVENGQNIIVDTIYGRTNTYYLDSISNDPNKDIIVYRIVAMDSCENLSLFPNAHNTMILNGINNYCGKSISLAWNGYSAWSKADVRYEILIKKVQDQKYKIFDIIDGNTLNYEVKGLENATIYEMKVRARNSVTNYASTTTKVLIKSHFLIESGELYLSNVSVNSDFTGVSIDWLIDKQADIKQFRIYRSENGKKQSLWNSQPYLGIKQYTLENLNIDINNSIYTYQVSSVDSCDAENIFSNMSHNILLSIESENGSRKLKWNLYDNWLGGIVTQRIIDETNSVVFGSVGSTEIEYANKLEKGNIKGQEFCFYVEAEEKINKYGSGKISKSNKVCITGEHIIFFPTAFNINSNVDENRIFAPKGKLINEVNSELVIYNRWGQQVWQSSGGVLVWDGKVNNGKDFAEAGVYIYVARIAGKAGETKKYTGTLTLLR